jgi:uncharacterized protein YkwD
MDTHGGKHLLAAVLMAVAGVAVLASLAVAAGNGGGAGGGGGGGGDTGCGHASDTVGLISDNQLRKAVICTINKERSRHARPRVKQSKLLDEAAQMHTDAMVKTNCLSHVCPHEPDLEQRVRRSGYLKGAKKWRYAEDTGCGLTAEAMVDNWLASTYHRLNILGRKFRDLGIGVSDGNVKRRCKPEYGTFTTVFAFRKPAH